MQWKYFKKMTSCDVKTILLSKIIKELASSKLHAVRDMESILVLVENIRSFGKQNVKLIWVGFALD